ncbi:MEMO1 family [Rhodocollybia butyracea]|uniref:MEMO1 family n=1 Tax=Rhodocollybia butyracea TaxID=206335 RepID=A0A9P5PV53_9AGAR|nr:MEMO1 family [Rhodocollybia butyracea]
MYIRYICIHEHATCSASVESLSSPVHPVKMIRSFNCYCHSFMSRAKRQDVRLASHAGSWYTDDGDQLAAELSGWLDKVERIDNPYPIIGCKAVIAPHAGYSYSGPAAAWAYKSIDTSGIKRVFILGPSHHLYLDGCALSGCKEYATPVGNLPLDLETIKELRDTGKFDSLEIDDDEAEHSLEMHLPYVRTIFKGMDISIVPIMVGAISRQSEVAYGQLLAPYLASEDTFCVVSSDFCHWGTRFSYTYYYPEPKPSNESGIRLSQSVAPSDSHPIHESISRLDHEAMDILTLPPSIASTAHAEFAKYLSKTKNTICGRHPIGVLLGALTALEESNEVHPTIEWVRYEQSSPCKTIRDSSVSYASAWVKF